MLDIADTLGRILHALSPAAPLAPLLVRPPGRPPIPDDAESVLRSPQRRAMYDRIVREPGVTASTVKKELEMLEGSFSVHLARLERAGLVEVRLLLGARCLFPTGAQPDSREGVFTSPTQRDVAAVVLAHPEGVGSGVVAEAVGITRRMAARHLGRLVDRRLASVTGAGPSTTYAPTAKLRKLLRPE